MFGKAFRRVFLFTPFFAAFLLSLVFPPCFAVGGDEASAAIGMAEDLLRKAFEAVLKAESVGADVSGLMDMLNEAGGLLAEAENAFKTGSFNEAFNRAEQCSALAGSVLGQAEALSEKVSVFGETVFRRNLAFSVVGSGIFLAALFYVWSWFKAAYFKRLLRMKPEAASDAET